MPIERVFKQLYAERPLDLSKSIGIIGGAGKMGRYFAGVCRGIGFTDIHIADVDTSRAEEAAAQLKAVVEDKRELAQKCDLTIVSVPIKSAINVIGEVGSFVKKGAVFAHFTSIQNPGYEAMKPFEQCERMGIHIMSAPTKDMTMGNMNVAVVSEVNSGEGMDFVKTLLAKTNANVTCIDPVTHDVISAMNQAAVQVNKFMYGYVMRQLGRKYNLLPRDFMAFNTPLSLWDSWGLGRILAANDPDMYIDLQMANPVVSEMLDQYLQGVKSFVDMVKTQDRNSFRERYDKIGWFFGRINATLAYRETTDLMKTIRRGYQTQLDMQLTRVRDFFAGDIRKLAVQSGCVGYGERVTHDSPSYRPAMFKLYEAYTKLEEALTSGKIEEADLISKNMINAIKKAPLRDQNLTASFVNAMNELIKLIEDLRQMREEVPS